ncbi:MAG: hypothetical protein JSV36_03050 [Anaerolineae bacterium]|nr:MAG: hypothetical protein JSV36_03050 [Anaerolineae bacterium]
MKKVFVFLTLAALLASLTVVVSAATPAPGGPFSSSFRVQNLGSSAAGCTVTYYNSAGAVGATSTLPSIAVGDSAYVYVPSVSGLADGMYSAVVACDQEVAAVVNYSDSDSGASFSGVGSDDAATTLYAPGVYNNYYNYYSNIVVQNTTSAPINMTVSIYAPGSSTPVATQSATNVPAYASASFEQEGLAGLSSGIPYSAKVVGTGNIAAVVNIYGKGGVAAQLYSYNPFASGSTTAYAPVIMNAYYGYNTSLTIQNLTSTSTSCTVTYGTGHTQSASVAGNSSVALYTPGSPVPAGTLTGAKVVCGQSVVVLVNESNRYNRAASYSGFATGATTVRAPIVMRRYYQYNTSITCQNIGSSAATMTIQYGGIAGSNTSPSISVNGTHLFYQPSDSLLSDNWIGSATITSAQDIVCIVNEDQNEGAKATTSMDQLYAYNGIGE